MTIKGSDYWELTEKERAALTRDEVAQYLSFELMRNGVLEPEPLTLAVSPPSAPLPTKPFYRLRTDRWNLIPLAFETERAARSAVDNIAMLIVTEYVGTSIECVVDAELVIECVQLPTKAAVDASRASLKEQAAIEADNERRRGEHAAAMKKVDAAVHGVWEDWAACRATAEQIAKVEATFAKYVRLAGSEWTAKKFLRQVFTIEQIAEAEEWTGRNFGSKDDLIEVLEAPEPISTVEALEV